MLHFPYPALILIDFAKYKSLFMLSTTDNNGKRGLNALKFYVLISLFHTLIMYFKGVAFDATSFFGLLHNVQHRYLHHFFK